MNPPSAAKSNSTPLSGSQLGERILLGALTTLIVARPFVAGDDPGRLRLTSGGGPLWLNLLTFLLLLGWGVWHGLTRRRLVIGPYLIIVVGLLAVAGCVFASAAQPDRYQRPGWFIGWDWVAYAALAFVAGQLATNAAIVRGLVAVLIATAGCLAAQALYEEAARVGKGPRTVPEPLSVHDLPMVGDDHYELNLNNPPTPAAAFRATLDQPDTLAALLLLIVPALLVWSLVGWRTGAKGSWNLPIALLLFIAAVMALIAWIVAMPTAGKGSQAAFAIIRDRPVFGAGPGNFSRNAPHGIVNAGSFWLGFGASAGLLAMVVFALALATAAGAFVHRARRPAIEYTVPPEKDYRWSFYIGGMAGLLLGMMLATGDLPVEAPTDELTRLGAVSAGRSLAWFLIFAALEMAAPASRPLALALATGVGLIALLGSVSEGLASPALMTPFVVVATLAMSRMTMQSNAARSSLPAAWIASPIAFALLAANFMHVGMPGLTTAITVRDARLKSVHLKEVNQQAAEKLPTDPVSAYREADDYLVGEILDPLKQAAKLDGGNSALFTEIALWERTHVYYLLQLAEVDRGRKRAAEILQLDEQIVRIDPRNPTPRFSEFEAMMFVLRGSREASPSQLARVERIVKQIVEYDLRREVFLCHRVVLVLLTRQNPQSADPWAVRLLRLDAVPGEPHGKLTPIQRRYLISQLKRIKEPSPELKELLKAGT